LPQQELLQHTLPQPDVSAPRQQVLPAQPLAGGLQAVPPHWVTWSAQKPLKQLPEQHSLPWVHGSPFSNSATQEPFWHAEHSPGQSVHRWPFWPQASFVSPVTQIPLAQQPGQVCGVQQGAAQKLPVVGHSESPGAAGMQAAPWAKPWHSASLVQLLGGPG
jgi:hypothetical protein